MKVKIPVFELHEIDGNESADVMIDRFADYLQRNNHLFTTHRHSFYHLVYFTKGSGSQLIDFEKYSINPGVIYFMSPGQVHNWMFEMPPDGYILNFKPDFFHSFLADPGYLQKFNFLNSAFDTNLFTLVEQDSEDAKRIFEAAIKAKTAQHPFSDDLLRILILELFILVGKSCAPNTEQPINYNRLLLNNFRKLLETHYKVYQFPRDYANLLYVTPNHLNALCKDQLGVSAGQLIRNRILLEAKRLLVNAEFTVQQISVDLGFKDVSYFVRFFKKYEQETPEKFRKKII